MEIIEKLRGNIAEINSVFQNIKSKIIEKGVEVDSELKPIDYSRKIEDVHEAGKKAEYNAFWDSVFSTGTWMALFAGRSWNNETFKPTQDLILSGNCNYCFYNNGANIDLVDRLAELGIQMNTAAMTSTNAVFAYCRFTRIGEIDCTKCSVLNSTFANTSTLITINKLIVHENLTYSSAFYYCSALKEIRIEGVIGQNGLNLQWSKALSKASIESIINALSTNTSGLTVTLSKTAVNKAFETSEGANDGESSSEWGTLGGESREKKNWTISLV